MVVRKRKKDTRQRGSYTHGWGSKKKHRGAGHRGGRGFAGVGKRGASKKTKYLAVGIQPLGKSGMIKIRNKFDDKTINIGELEKKFPDQKEIDLTALGYDKLLGTGKLSKKINIKVSKISKRAKEKLEALGVKLAE